MVGELEDEASNEAEETAAPTEEVKLAKNEEHAQRAIVTEISPCTSSYASSFHFPLFKFLLSFRQVTRDALRNTETLNSQKE